MQTVPLKIVLPLLLIVPLMVWFWGARKYDFMTPRVIPESELRPDFASPVNGDLVASLRPPVEEPIDPEPVFVPDLAPGDFQTSPSLAEYLEYAPVGSPALLKLAEKLQSDGHLQRAVLAYERIIDSTPPISLERGPAEEALAILKATLPRWNVDPTAAIPLTVNLVTSRSEEALQPSLAAISELIAASSGGLCQPSFILQTAPEPTETLPARPFALWLTVGGEDPEVSSLPVLTVAPDTEEDFDSQLAFSLYRLLARRVLEVRELTPIPPVLESEDPESILVSRITRLSWQKVLQTPIQSYSEDAILLHNETEKEESPPENEESEQ